MGVGMAQCAFDHAAAHVRRRSAFGSKLGAFQHWQFRMAEHAITLESARALYQKAARKSDAGVTPEPEDAMAKITGSRAAVDLARDAIQVHGAYGFVREQTADGTTNHLESIWRDSKVGEIYEGRKRSTAMEHRTCRTGTRSDRLNGTRAASWPGSYRELATAFGMRW
jgi:alkylation response protein AidB-like acyl-CoA dehydrogenase